MTNTSRKSKPKQIMSPVPEKWTWQMAQEALAKNTANRHIRDVRVVTYARMMKEKGMWGTESGARGVRASLSLLIFDWDGNLIDGQHRLSAQVLTRTTQYWYVIRNADPAAQLHIDGNIPRSAADALKFAGYANYTQLSSVARWAWMLEQGMVSSGKITVGNDEVVDMVERHPDLTHSTVMGLYVRTGIYKHVIRGTSWGAAHWWIAQHSNHAEADAFLDRVAHIRQESEGSALVSLLDRLTTARNNHETVPIRVQIAMICKAWNLDVKGVGTSSKSYSRNRNGEFPVPDIVERVISQEVRYGPFTDAEVESGVYDDVINAEAS